MYHLLINIFPKEGQTAVFLQLYVHDNQEEQRNLQNKNSEVDKEVLFNLQKLMEEYNPMVIFNRQCAQVMIDNPTAEIYELL